MTFETSALILAWVAIVLLAFGMSGMLRQIRMMQVGPVRLTRVGPDAGEVMPVRPGGGKWGAATLLLFLDADCTSCSALAPAIDEVAEVERGIDVIAVYATTPDVVHTTGVEVVSNAQELFDVYRVPVTPFAVVVDDAGTVNNAQPVGSLQELHAVLNHPTGMEAIDV